MLPRRCTCLSVGQRTSGKFARCCWAPVQYALVRRGAQIRLSMVRSLGFRCTLVDIHRDTGKENITTHCRFASASEALDCSRLLLEESSDEDSRYLLLQRIFECNDQTCYVETHEQTVCGYYGIRRCRLSPGSLLIDCGQEGVPPLEVNLDISAKEFALVKDMLNVILSGMNCFEVVL